MDVEAYCTGCNSDQHTRLDPERHPHLRWCDLCWAWQKPLSPRVRKLVLLGLEAEKQKGAR